MRTQNRRTMINAAAVCLALLVVGACSELGLSGAQDVFEVGSTYRFEFLGASGDVRILEAPDERGWALVEVVDGFSDLGEGEFLLNTSNALIAWLVDMEPAE